MVVDGIALACDKPITGEHKTSLAEYASSHARYRFIMLCGRYSNKWSKQFDKRPHRCCTWMVQWYPTGGTPPWAHPSLQPKQHFDRFSHFCTAHGRVSVYFTMGHAVPFPPNIALSRGGSGPPSNTWFLGLIRVQNPNGISISSTVLQGSLLCQTDHAASVTFFCFF